MPESAQATSHATPVPVKSWQSTHGGIAATRCPGQPGDCANMLLFDRCRLPIVTRTVKPDDHPQPTQICVYEAGARDADPVDLLQRNSLIDIDRNFSAGLHLTRISCARIIIRICTDTEINVVVNP
jgi:hypothetical protein